MARPFPAALEGYDNRYLFPDVLESLVAISERFGEYLSIRNVVNPDRTPVSINPDDYLYNGRLEN